jgi:drug/metabolite transporter (DMT)-like permease
MTEPATIRRATSVGAGAVLLWAALAVLATAAGPVPPFQLVAMAFALAFALALGTWIVRGETVVRHLALAPRVWALGIGGLFGYHACYFAALSLAPPVEANLINYLWPLLIVLFSGLLPGERLTAWHLAGAAAGLAGCAVLIGIDAARVQPQFIPGYVAAAAAAVIWAGYSVLSRRFGHVPTDAVGAFCGATALLAAAAHFVFETTYWPLGGEWLAVLGLGLGPVGTAFFLWDVGMKRGDIKALGALSYATPLLSTLLLIAFGRAALGWRVAAACLLIVGGAVLASRDLWRKSEG